MVGARRAAAPASPLRAYAYSSLVRLLAAVASGVAGASLPFIGWRVVAATDPPVTPEILAHLVVVLAAAPAASAWLLARLVAVRVDVGREDVVISRRDLRVDVPCDAIVGVWPWRIPLPAPGVALRLASGRQLRWGLASADPLPLLRALVEAGGVRAARAAFTHPTVVWAHARAGRRRWWWDRPLAKFVLFTFLPAAVLFNAHQHIAYGGTLGEYYLLGPAAWLRTLAVHWATIAVYCVLYASLWRGLGEVVALAAAGAAPSHAARMRRAVETSCRVLYYGGVPVLLGLRFLPW
jgi:hypothetical protein